MSPNPILDAIFAPWHISVVTTACRLKVFSRLDGRRLSAGELAHETGCVPRLLEALLDACVAMGLLRYENGAYANTHLSSAHLVEGRPLYVGNILEVQAGDAALWGRLLDVVRTGEAPLECSGAGEQEAVFTLAMNDLGVLGEAEALAAAVDLSDRETLLDVGCGSGIYAIAFCRRHPRLHAILIDREQVLRTTARFVAASGLADRIRMSSGDMTKGMGDEKADVVLLSDSLYFDRATSIRTLQLAYATLNPGGTVVIRGYYSDTGGSGSLFGSLFRLNLLVFDPSRTPPTAPDVLAYLGEVGFKGSSRLALTERSTCFVGTK